MLSWSCRRFRAGFTPGSGHPHRQACPACAAYAAAMERAAQKTPLPSRLRSKLRAVPATVAAVATAGDDSPRMPLAQEPLPEALRGRLRSLGGIQRGQRGRRIPLAPLPAWLSSPRYAIAACYLLAVLTGALAGNPAQLGRDAANAVSRTVDRAVRPRVEGALAGVADAEHHGRRRLENLESTARERYSATRSSLERSLDRLENRAHELAELRKSLFSTDLLPEGD